MIMTRYALLMTALVAFPSGLAIASTPADEAEYLGGTVKSIQTWDPWLNHANQSVDGTHPYNHTENQVWSQKQAVVIGRRSV